MRYNKPPLDLPDLIALLESRNLTINDKDRALRYLRNVGYYRLSGYMYHLQKNGTSHEFKDGVTFNFIIQHYKFDKDLRVLIKHYLERIEIALRARLTDYYCIKHGFYWYVNKDLYANQNTCLLINDEIKIGFESGQETFLRFFKHKYYQEEMPPSNMAMELLTFGKITRLYRGLENNSEKMLIASDFGLPTTILSSWLVYLNNVRNICAHHGRLWNRKLTADKPIIPSRKKHKFNGELPDDFNISVFGVVCLIDRLLFSINSKNSFTNRVVELIERYIEFIDPKLMGFPDDWKDNKIWTQNNSGS